MIFTHGLKRFLSLIAFFGLTSQAIAVPSYDFFKDSAERIDEAAALLKKSPTDAASMVLFLENLRDSYYIHLDRIEAALPYWEWAKHHPYRYTASQFPHKWFTHEKNQAEIEKIHAMISAVREVYSKEFGIIVRLLAMRQEDMLDDAAWLAEVKKGVATILMTPLEDLSSTELIIQKLSDHEKDVAKMVEKVQSPNWLKRHWRSLLTTAVVAAAAIYFYRNNKESADNFCIDGVTRLKTNFIEYCYNPVKSFVDTFWNKSTHKIVLHEQEKYKINLPGQFDEQGKPVTVLMSSDEVLKKCDELKTNMHQKIEDSSKVFGGLKQGSSNAQNSVDTQNSIETTAPTTQNNGFSFHSIGMPDIGARFRGMLAPTVDEKTAEFKTLLEDKIDAVGKGTQGVVDAVGEAAKRADLLMQVTYQDKERIMSDARQLMLDAAQKSEKIDFTFQLACLIPAGLFSYLSFQGVRNLFGWFTKRDRSTLINRLRQVQQVLIRTTYNTELSDTEYGRLLYLLTKTHDQVIKNVPSNERIAFLNDLTYIANAQSSIKQKRKTLKTMWNSYHSLQQSA